MDTQKILEYQKLDSKLFKIEKSLRESENKKKSNEMFSNMKNAQAKSVQLEDKAGNLFNEITKVKKQFQIQEEKMNEFMAKDIESLSKEEVQKLIVLKDKLAKNLSILEKNLSALAENANAILGQFNSTIKTFNVSKEKYLDYKAKFEEEEQKLKQEQEEIEEQLKKLEKNVDAKTMEAYKKRRKENIFPVVVPLMDGNSCGGCRTEIPVAYIAVLDRDGVLSCEHCHRLIYKN